MTHEEDEDALDVLISAANQFLEKTENDEDIQSYSTASEKSSGTSLSARKLVETDIFKPTVNTPSLIHTRDTDSSDDEGNRNYENKKYNEYGKEIKTLLAGSLKPSLSYEAKKQTSSWKTKPNTPVLQSTAKEPLKKQPQYKADVYTDSVFFIRIINPLISSSTLQERMMGREAVHMSKLSRFIQMNPKERDWVIAGVIVNKSCAKMSQKGSQYSIWTLSDLHGDIKTVALFLFSGAHANLWKTAVGTVVGVLNPNILDKKDGSKDEATLSVDNAQKVMIFGQSKDFATCKSTKKNGEKCTAIVNTNKCEYCIYHIKQEYQKCSLRSELQSNFTGRGLHALRNKVLGKNEVFYAGKSYMAIPAKKSKKLEQRDNNRLLGLSGKAPLATLSAPKSRGGRKQTAARLDVSPAQRMRDIELLKKLGGGLESKNNFTGIQSDGLSMEQAKQNAVGIIKKLKSKQVEPENAPKSSQYDMKMDLILNVDNKTNFEGKTSDNVTTDESRLAALSLMSKLSANPYLEKKNDPEDEIGTGFTDEILDDDDINLGYDNDSDDGPIESSTPSKEVHTNNKTATNSEEKQQNYDKLCKVPKERHGNPEKSRTQMPTTKTTTKSDSKTTEKTTLPLSKNQQTICNKSTVVPTNSNNAEKSTSLLTPKSNGLSTPMLASKQIFHEKNVFQTIVDVNTSANDTKESSTPKSAHKGYHEEKITKSGAPAKHVNKLIAGISNLSRPDLCSGNLLSKPILSSDGFGPNNMIDLSKPLIPRRADKAKLNAIKLVQKIGPIEKADPNNIRGSGKKRPLPELDNNPAKKSKLAESEFMSDRFKKMMAATSKHMDLLEARDEEEKEKYFNKLEVKEKMEEKMTNTFKMDCKAVRCLQCKYTSFSASDLCKKERHPLKVFDAVKRFFKCGNCGNRNASLQLVPTRPCNNCGSGKWERTGMMKEKIVTATHSLSIRGGEQKYVNSNVSDANINLLVPEAE